MVIKSRFVYNLLVEHPGFQNHGKVLCQTIKCLNAQISLVWISNFQIYFLAEQFLHFENCFTLFLNSSIPKNISYKRIKFVNNSYNAEFAQSSQALTNFE